MPSNDGRQAEEYFTTCKVPQNKTPAFSHKLSKLAKFTSFDNCWCFLHPTKLPKFYVSAE
jgi:hypothetical protein